MKSGNFRKKWILVNFQTDKHEVAYTDTYTYLCGSTVVCVVITGDGALGMTVVPCMLAGECTLFGI